MTPERWATVERICHAALGREEPERTRFLAEACAGDEALRRDVESLLEHDGSAAFLSTPAAVHAGHAVASGGALIGQSVGPYVISSRLGAGGMGEVYRARDQKLGRDVAIKILPAIFTFDPERLARFAREARVLAALNHPHIGAIYGLEEFREQRALILELVEGETLAERIQRGALAVKEALPIARQIADALDASHEKGIVHRDLKPANIILQGAWGPTPTRYKTAASSVDSPPRVWADHAINVKVLDFGLAKVASAVTDLSQSPTITVTGTHEGVLLGTAAYMSPEQARGQAVDKRADVWAFGCVLYEMLTGRTAFSGPTVSDTLAAILDREPDWTALPAAIPAAIHRLLRRCLEKDANLRLRDMADGRFEIDEALGPPSTDRSLGENRRSPTVAVAAVVLTVAVFGAWAVSRVRQPDATLGRVLRLQISPPESGQFGRLGSGFGPNLALSPDGRTAVFGATVDGKYALWLRSLDDTKARLLRGTEDARWPFWSPDGRSIAFFARGKLQRIDVAGGAAFAICDVPTAYGGAWSADGRILVGISGGTLASVAALGGVLTPLTALDASTADIAHTWPQLLPGGRFLYLAVSTNPEHDHVVYAASFEKPNERVRLVTSGARALYASGLDGHGYLLWERGGALVAQEFDIGTLKFSGEPRPIADAVGFVQRAAYLAVAVSANGTLVYASADLQQLTWFDRAGKQLGKLSDPGHYRNDFRLSPDGSQLATSRGQAELWLTDVAHGTSRRTTFASTGAMDPLWSPDGRTILFRGDDGITLYRKDPIGVEADQRLAPLISYDFSYFLTDWSRDGGSLLNTRRTVKTQDDIWVLPVTPNGHLAGNAQAIPYLRTPVNEAAGRFLPEPNPRWIAYQSDESGRDEVYVQSFPEPRGPHRISTNGGTGPQWGPGGRELFYQAPGGKVTAVNLKLGPDSVEPSVPRELFALPPQSIFEVAADGQRFLVNVPDPTPRPLTVIVNWPSLLKSPEIGH